VSRAFSSSGPAGSSPGLVRTEAQDAGHNERGREIVVRNKSGTQMPGNPREMITTAERRYPVRIRIGVLPGGFGQRYTQMTAWLDENCGADGWALTPSGCGACSTTRSRSTSRMQCSPARSSHGGAPGRRPRPWAVHSRCARMSQRRGSAWGCTERRKRSRRTDCKPSCAPVCLPEPSN
jgi:hypothetical protein